MDDLSDICDRFALDRFATEACGLTIEDARAGYARVGFDIEARHANAMGSVMGGAIFTAADFALAVAANFSRMEAVNVSSDIQFVGRAKGSRIIAEATCKKDGRTLCFYTVHVYDDRGTDIAFVNATGYKGSSAPADRTSSASR
jgi:acyl-CoA thioesterase